MKQTAEIKAGSELMSKYHCQLLYRKYMVSAQAIPLGIINHAEPGAMEHLINLTLKHCK